METTPEAATLLDELYDRAAVIDDLDGPQLEAWVSGLFPVLDTAQAVRAFVEFASQQGSTRGALLCAAIAELTAGLDADVAAASGAAASSGAGSRVAASLPSAAAQLGSSRATDAWQVEAPFGRSIVVGFLPGMPGSAPENADRGTGHESSPASVDEAAAVPVVEASAGDGRHSILVELTEDGGLEDLQLAGPPRELLDDAVASDRRVQVTPLSVEDAWRLVIEAWPREEVASAVLGPGVAANQQFVRRRILRETGTVVPAIAVVDDVVDVRRGMSEREFDDANRAARSTLRAAVGEAPETPEAPETGESAADSLAAVWAGVVRGDGGELSARERDALLWLEWADWLGVGIGLLRSSPGCAVSGDGFVDLVNRCPEVSSTIDKADREYAAWAFDIALDLLRDAGIVEEGVLTGPGHASLHPGLIAAWS